MLLDRVKHGQEHLLWRVLKYFKVSLEYLNSHHGKSRRDRMILRSHKNMVRLKYNGTVK